MARADAIAAQLAMAEEELAGVAALRRGRVRLAAFPSASATLVPRALARIGQAAPSIDVALTEAEPPEALALLADGQVDLALVFGYREAPVPTTTGLSWVPLGREPVRWCCRPAGRRRAGRWLWPSWPTSRGSPAATAAGRTWSTCARRPASSRTSGT